MKRISMLERPPNTNAAICEDRLEEQNQNVSGYTSVASAAGDHLRFFTSIEDGDFDAARALLAQNPRLTTMTDGDDRNALMVAVASPARSCAMVDLLLDAGVRADWIDADGRGVVHWAMVIKQNDDLEILLRRLVAAGAPLEHPGTNGWTPLVDAVVSGTAHEVATLVAVGARVDVAIPDDSLPPFALGCSLLDLAGPDTEKRHALASCNDRRREGPARSK